METDKDHIHFLVEYDATDRVCDIVKVVKQETTYYLWQTKGFNLWKKCCTGWTKIWRSSCLSYFWSPWHWSWAFRYFPATYLGNPFPARAQLLFADRRHGDGHDSGDSDPHTDPASDHRSNRHGPDPVRCQFLTGSRRSKQATPKSFRSPKRHAMRYDPQHSRSMHRFRTRSMRIFMLHIQRIWQRRSKRVSLPTGGIPSYPPVAISFALLFTKTSGISPLCTCQFVIPGGLILLFYDS